MSEPTPPASADWYPDPQDPAQERYWDGIAWTGDVRSPEGSAMIPPPPPPPPPPPAAARPPRTTTRNGFSIAGIFFGVLAFLILPIIFGPVGLTLGAVAKNKGEPLANRALLVAAIGMAVGMLLGVLASAA